MNIFKKALVATIATSFIVAGGGIGATASAQASPSQLASLVDGTQDATLHIHKHATPEGDLVEGNGAQQTVTSPGVAGAQFTIERLNDDNNVAIDLTTAAGWQAAQDIDPSTPKATLVTDPLHPTGIYTTDTNGEITVDLPLGLYRVKEVQAPVGYNSTNNAFLVTLPMTNPTDRNAWMYDVHVYPKNDVVDPTVPTKTVADAGVQAGDALDYTITSPLQGYTDFTFFQIKDKYPTDRLENPVVNSVTLNGTALASTDYTINTTVAGEVAITMTSAGLLKLSAAPNGGSVVKANLSFDVINLTATPAATLGPITNNAEVSQSNQGTPGVTDPSVPPTGTVPVPLDPNTLPKSFYGAVKLIKTGQNSSGQEVKLAGAEFQVYECTSADELGTLLEGFSGVTNANGELYITGLHANNFIDGAPTVADLEARGEAVTLETKYCLVETKAAPGYELLTDPIEFQVRANLIEGTISPTELMTEIENVQANAGFDLPLTGGKGVAIILGAGLILLIAGGAYYLMQRRNA
ncbi:SpaH/EbpB family LPXTG-anchored major pilin [Corynebacterium callunae]|uniref:SpaH/EbpB family LPXTG-anchored major pilin n=1 Tax=Corynebacterium callunae TaxID=1721 RepID=UPI003982928A